MPVPDPDQPSAPVHLRIDAVAQRTGLTKRTIRYYEEIGLVTPSGRSEGNYRLYTEADVLRLERIQRMKQSAGFSLSEILEMLDAEGVRDRIRERYHSVADRAERARMLDESISVLSRQRALVLRKRKALDTLRTEYEERLARLTALRDELVAPKTARR
jgi:MerR family transcriptional regulator, repressor of the yfmOP operon